MLSYLVMGTPELSFLAIEDDATRFPIEAIRVDGSSMRWLRADGYPEAIDLEGCASKELLLQSFETDHGVLFALFPSLEGADLKAESRCVVISVDGFVEIPAEEEDQTRIYT